MFICYFFKVRKRRSRNKEKKWTLNIKKKIFFTNSAPLGRVGHRVAMSVCGDVCVSVCLRHRVQFFVRPLIGPQVT